MSRIRSIHPGFFRDEDLVPCSAFARLLYLGLGVEADDKGIFEWKPVQIRMTILPGDNVDVVALLAELVQAGNIKSFEVGGKRYGAIRNFRKYQRPKTPNDIHPMPQEIADFVSFPRSAEIEQDDAPSFPPKVEKSPQMEEGGEEEGSKKEISLDDERDFEVWYHAYPRHVGKGQARKAYRTARKKVDAGTLLDAAHAAAKQFALTEPQYTPHPATWLGGERWLDVPAAPNGGKPDSDEAIYRGVL